jgi:hypothetical protein
MLIRAILKSSADITGEVIFTCDSLADFDFIITSDPFIELLDFELIDWSAAVLSNLPLVQAAEYRQQNELCEHNRYPLAELFSKENEG